MVSNLPEAASAKRQMQQVAISWDPKKNTPLLGKTILRVRCPFTWCLSVPRFSVRMCPRSQGSFVYSRVLCAILTVHKGDVPGFQAGLIFGAVFFIKLFLSEEAALTIP